MTASDTLPQRRRISPALASNKDAHVIVRMSHRGPEYFVMEGRAASDDDLVTPADGLAFETGIAVGLFNAWLEAPQPTSMAPLLRLQGADFYYADCFRRNNVQALWSIESELMRRASGPEGCDLVAQATKELGAAVHPNFKAACQLGVDVGAALLSAYQEVDRFAFPRNPAPLAFLAITRWSSVSNLASGKHRQVAAWLRFLVCVLLTASFFFFGEPSS